MAENNFYSFLLTEQSFLQTTFSFGQAYKVFLGDHNRGKPFWTSHRKS